MAKKVNQPPKRDGFAELKAAGKARKAKAKPEQIDKALSELVEEALSELVEEVKPEPIEETQSEQIEADQSEAIDYRTTEDTALNFDNAVSGKSDTAAIVAHTSEENVTTAANYDDVVREGKEIVAQRNVGRWRLGELAHQLDTVYKEHTLEDYAYDIGVSFTKLERYRSVYRGWMTNPAPAPVSWSVLRELAAHPDNFGIVSRNPTITKFEAREEMRAWRDAQAQPATPTEPEPAVPEPPSTAADQAESAAPTPPSAAADPGEASDLENTRRWWSDFRRATHTVGDYNDVTPRFATAPILRRVVPPPLLPIVRAELEGALKTVDFLESLFQEEVRGAAE